MGTWKPGAQRFRDSGAGGESGLVKCCRIVSCNVYTPHYVPCVNIERNNNYCLIGRVGFCRRQCFTPTNKGSRNCSGGDNANNNRSPETQLHARFAGTGEGFGRNFGPEAMQSVHIKYKLGAIL